MFFVFSRHRQSFWLGDDPSSHLTSHTVLAPFGIIFFKVKGTGSVKQEQSCYCIDPVAQLLEHLKILKEAVLELVIVA